jgi:hypothetical protein
LTTCSRPSAPGYDPFDDITLAARVAALNATSAA